MVRQVPGRLVEANHEDPHQEQMPREHEARALLPVVLELAHEHRHPPVGNHQESMYVGHLFFRHAAGTRCTCNAGARPGENGTALERAYVEGRIAQWTSCKLGNATAEAGGRVRREIRQP